MNRSSFGRFGRELVPDEFAQALAAAGVLLAADGALPGTAESAAARLAALVRRREVVTWALRDPGVLGASPSRVAGWLARAWRERVCASALAPRLLAELPPSTPFDEWILANLSRPAVGAIPSFRAEPPDLEVGLSWPVRFGFLDDGRSRELQDAISAARPYPELFTVAPLAEAPDLLLVPHGVRGALRSALGRPGREAADCVVVLGGLDADPSTAYRHLASLREVVATGGVAVLEVPEARRVALVVALIEALSHDLALDEALFEAARRGGLRPPLLVASRSLLDAFRLTASAHALAGQLDALPAGEALPVDEPTKEHLGIPPAASTGPQLGGELRGRVGRFGFGGESHEATDLARMRRSLETQLGPTTRRTRGGRSKAKRKAMAAPPAAGPAAATPVTHAPAPAPRAPRDLQAEMFEPDPDGALKQTHDALVAGSAYVLSFFIGPPREGTARADAEFPEDMLPPSEDGHDLTVVFAEVPPVGDLGAPQVGTLHLPPEGESTPCTFAIRPAPGAASFEGRVTVLFENRVLQTARVLAHVVAAAPRGALELRLSVIEVDTVEEAGRRAPTDAALVFNATSTGRHTATAIAGETASIAALSNLPGAIQTLSHAIAAYTDLERGPGGLSKKDMVKFLAGVAEPGRLLWDQIERALPARVRAAPRLHVVQADVGVPFPVELLYSAPAPDADAELCTGAPQPDPDRPCTKCPTGPEATGVACINQFWGLRAVFEREPVPEQLPPPGTAATLRPESSSTGKPLRIDAALLATSELVDEEVPAGGAAPLPSEAVQGALAELVGPGTVTRVRSLKEWKDAVAKSSPELIVLVVHRMLDENTPSIEIEGEPIHFAKIEDWHLRGPRGGAPAVILMGCSTANAREGALDIVPRLLVKRASVVVGTLAPVLGRYAGPATAQLVRALDARRREGAVSFAQALLEVKRALLARGEPIGLSLVAFGEVQLGT